MIVDDLREIHNQEPLVHHQKVDDASDHDDADEKSDGECGGRTHSRTLLLCS
jgi:hypothetical protein